MRSMMVAALLSQLLVGACSVVGVRSGTPEPSATVIDQVGMVQIRRYDPVLVAETVVTGSEDDVRSEGFRRLAAYIFGRNVRHDLVGKTAATAQTSSETIAMTAPVAQTEAPGAAGRSWTIRFFLPAGMTQATAPKPLDARVVLVEVPARTMAVLRFSGLPTPAAVAAYSSRLDSLLAKGRWRPEGPSVAWFYDPPWTLPPFRRNEVARAVQ